MFRLFFFQSTIYNGDWSCLHKTSKEIWDISRGVSLAQRSCVAYTLLQRQRLCIDVTGPRRHDNTLAAICLRNWRLRSTSVGVTRWDFWGRHERNEDEVEGWEIGNGDRGLPQDEWRSGVCASPVGFGWRLFGAIVLIGLPFATLCALNIAGLLHFVKRLRW